MPSGTPHRLERMFFVRDATTGQTRAWAVGFGGTILALGANGISLTKP